MVLIVAGVLITVFIAKKPTYSPISESPKTFMFNGWGIEEVGELVGCEGELYKIGESNVIICLNKLN